MSAPATLSRADRKRLVRANALAMIKGPPPGWDAWSVQTARLFKDCCETLGKDESLPQLLGAARTLAEWYGRPMTEIDPCHGQP